MRGTCVLAVLASAAAAGGKLAFSGPTGPTCIIERNAAGEELNSGCDLSVTKDGETTSLLSLKADIAAAISTLQQKIDDIALTPGPKGDDGVAGPKGDKGEVGADSTKAGPAGADSTVAGPKGDKGEAGAGSSMSSLQLRCVAPGHNTICLAAGNN
jgi:hypothetical protein